MSYIHIVPDIIYSHNDDETTTEDIKTLGFVTEGCGCCSDTDKAYTTEEALSKIAQMINDKWEELEKLEQLRVVLLQNGLAAANKSLR